MNGADLIILVGGRLDEQPSQAYALLDVPGPRPTLVHVFPGVEELGRIYHPHLAIDAAPTAFAAALEGLELPSELRLAAEHRAPMPTSSAGPRAHGRAGKFNSAR